MRHVSPLFAIDFIIFGDICELYIFIVRIFRYEHESFRELSGQNYCLCTFAHDEYGHVNALCHGNFALLIALSLIAIVFVALCFLDDYVACLIPSSIIVPVCLSSFNVTCFLSPFPSYSTVCTER